MSPYDYEWQGSRFYGDDDRHNRNSGRFHNDQRGDHRNNYNKDRYEYKMEMDLPSWFYGALNIEEFLDWISEVE